MWRASCERAKAFSFKTLCASLQSSTWHPVSNASKIGEARGKSLYSFGIGEDSPKGPTRCRVGQCLLVNLLAAKEKKKSRALFFGIEVPVIKRIKDHRIKVRWIKVHRIKVRMLSNSSMFVGSRCLSLIILLLALLSAQVWLAFPVFE